MIALVTDRTQADVNRLTELTRKALTGTGETFADRLTDAEQAEWLALNNKGAYNASDLNRVSAACATLYDVMIRAGYEILNYVPPKGGWMDTDIPTKDEMQRYINAVATIKQAANGLEYIPDTMEGLDWYNANAIERLLKEVDDFIWYVQIGYMYSGEVISGEF